MNDTHQHRTMQRMEVVHAIIKPTEGKCNDDVMVACNKMRDKVLEQADVDILGKKCLVHGVVAFQKGLKRPEQGCKN